MTEKLKLIEPFDNTKPPPAPPNKEGYICPFVGFVETKQSKKTAQEYKRRLAQYNPSGNTKG